MSGNGDRSVEMKLGTPSIKLDGTAASKIQRSRRNQVTGSSLGRLMTAVGRWVSASRAPTVRTCAFSPFLRVMPRC